MKEKFLSWQGIKRRELFLSCCGFDSYIKEIALGFWDSAYFNIWHSPDLAKEVKPLDLERGMFHSTTIPTVTNSQVSVTQSLMSLVMYAAPVTSNVIREMPATATWRREIWLFGSELFVSRFTLSVPSGRARAITQGGGEQIKIYYVWSCIVGHNFR